MFLFLISTIGFRNSSLENLAGLDKHAMVRMCRGIDQNVACMTWLYGGTWLVDGSCIEKTVGMQG